MNMDFDDIGNRIANLTMYDVKQLYTAAKNYALNVSDIEAKVNEATSDDPWGASSTLMQDIAAATNNFQDFNEIMPAIYRNFMEREAREWRQIYKALQLLEYIIKHGSERVVDDARSHLSTIKILRNFHYTDDQGKDQGINVRNRAKEIAELLSDVERIRIERRKARQNKQKYQGVGNNDFVPGSGGGRYGGFGSDSFYAGGSGGAGAYGGGSSGGGGGGRESSSGQRDSFEAYDAGDDDTATPAHRVGASGASVTRSSGRSSTHAPLSGKKQEAKVADLFSFDDDDDEPTTGKVSAPSGTASASDGFDDFDEFQAAPTPAAPTASARPTKAPSSATSAAATKIFDFLGNSDTTPQASQPSAVSAAPMQPQRTSSTVSVPQSKPTTASSTSSVNFDDLWATSAGKQSTFGGAAGKGKMTMAQLAAQKSNSSVWGGGSASGTANKAKDPFDFL